MLIVMVPSSAALVLAAGALITYDFRAFESSTRDDLLSGAKIVGSNCAAAIMFDDPVAAARILSALAVHRDVVAAYTYARQGRLFAQYVRPGSGAVTPRAEPPGFGFHEHQGRLLVVHPISLDGERVGVICIESDRSEMWVQLRRYVLTVGPVIMAAFLLALMLQRSLSPLLTVPLSHLAETAEHVSRTKDYSLRARKFSEDEIGRLIESFNAMLAQIQERDAALHEAQVLLEDRVRERTLELQQEVAERQRAEQTLRESEAKYRELVQNANSIILRMTPDGVVTYFNEFAQTFFGFTESEILGRNVVGTIVPYRDTASRDLSAMIQDIGQHPERYASNENENIRRNGERVWVTWTNRAIRDPEGNIVETFCVGNDISARKIAEEALRKAKEEAEAANLELEAAIERANRMAMQAELANNAKSAFLANMSHEIRTPMNGIVGMSGLLLDTPLTLEQREYAMTVRASAESLLELINEILDFSKIEAGKISIETTDFDLRATLEEVINLLWVRADDKGLQLGCLIHPGVPVALRGDPGRLRQILINLVGNAIKFTDRGDILVEVEAKNVTNSHAVISVEITDSGIGIPADRQHLLFQSFSQVDASTTRRYGGTGLGLAISKQLVELMGGQIDVRSETGKGSTFWFSVLFERQPPEHDAEPVDTRDKHVLVVGGSSMQRRILKTQAESWACRAEEAPDEAAALDALYRAAQDGDPFDVALVDAILPGGAGDALCRQIKSAPALASVHIILLYALARMPHADHLQEIGAEACLHKPVKQSHLYDCLVNILSGHGHYLEKGYAEGRYIPESEKKNLRILLVEDNAVNQKVALRMLERAGYQADVAANGREAVAACAEEYYDIILMDVQMPEMDGYEATVHIRKQQENSGRRSVIIAMTAHAMKGDREHCIVAGMDDYVSKPLDPQLFLGAIERHYARGVPVEAPPPKAPPTQTAAAVYDKAGFLRRVEGDERLLREVLRTFLQDCPRQMINARKSLEQRDAVTLTRIAHTVKGASASVGAMAINEVATRLEDAAREQNLDLAPSLLADLETELARFSASAASEE
jgi:PAS domain S-box-containing protein